MNKPNAEAVKRGIVIGCKVVPESYPVPFRVNGFDKDGDPAGFEDCGEYTYEHSYLCSVVEPAPSLGQRCIAELDDAAETCAQEGGNPAEFWALIAEHAEGRKSK